MLPSLPPDLPRRPRTRSARGRRVLRTVGLLAAVSGLAVTSCTDAPITGARHRSVPAIALSAGDGTDPAAAPLGIGGAYTLTAGGIAVSGVPVAPTGIVVPAGIPVRVQVAGAITRTQTPGLQEFCALPQWEDACAGAWADIIAETPIGPSGLDFWPGRAAALVAWEGGAPASPEPGRTSVSGTSGGELHFGRTGWGCYYSDAEHDLSGNCFTFGGAFTVTVQADGGTDTDGDGIPDALDPDDDGDGIPDEEDDDHDGEDAAGLGAELVRSIPVGGSTDATVVARYRDGASVAGFRWSFIPDVVTTANGDTVPEMEMAMMASTASSDLPPGIERVDATHVRLPDGRIVGEGLHIYEIPAPEETHDATAMLAMSAASSATGAIALSDCNSVSSCSALVPATSGTFLVTAIVDGKQRSASARLGAVAPKPPAEAKLDCTPQVARGNVAHCEVVVVPEDARATAKLEVSGWQFMPSDPGVGNPPVGTISRTANRSSTVWEGPMVVDGTVMVEGTLDGKPFKSTAPIAVAARAWGNKAIAIEVIQNDPGKLPPEPTGFEGQLGATYPSLKFNLENMGFVSDGPNTGLVYFKEVPVSLKFVVSVNTAALSANSAFWQIQPPTTREINGKKICGRNTFSRVLQLAYKHEGLSRQDKNSHVQIFTDTFEREMRREAALLERMVGNGDIADPLALPERWFNLANKESEAMDNDSGRNVITNVSMGCDDFNYTYPSGGAK